MCPSAPCEAMQLCAHLAWDPQRPSGSLIAPKQIRDLLEVIHDGRVISGTRRARLRIGRAAEDDELVGRVRDRAGGDDPRYRYRAGDGDRTRGVVSARDRV